MTDYNGAAVAVNGVENSVAGLGFITLPMKDGGNRNIGHVKVNLTFSGVAGVAGGDQNAKEYGLRSLWSGTSGSNIFSGGMPTVTATKAELQDGDAAAEKTALFGGLSKADILTQLQAVDPSVNTLTSHSESGTENMKYTNGNVASASYALGIADGQTIEATFDTAVTASTQWSAPLNVAITYN